MAVKTKTEEQREAENRKRIEDFYKEKVPVYVIKPEGTADNSITVTVNGVNYQILYNTDVMVPRFVAKVIEESARNRTIADENIQRHTGGAKPLGEM